MAKKFLVEVYKEKPMVKANKAKPMVKAVSNSPFNLLRNKPFKKAVSAFGRLIGK